MPHVIVKVWTGKPEEQKVRLAAAIAKDITAILGAPDEATSVLFEDVPQQEWEEKVVKGEVLPNWDKLTKKPRRKASASD